jgi:hypothetical protein
LLTTSWDDGHPLDMRVAERLAAHELPGTFYVPKQPGFPVIGPTDIRALQDMGFEIGAHTLNHGTITDCGEEAAREQIKGSRAWVESVTGRSCAMFCFPKGRFGLRDLNLAAEAGFFGVRGVEYLSTEWPRQTAGIWVMATTVQTVRQTRMRMARNLVSRYRWRRLILRLPEILHAKEWVRVGLRIAKEVRDQGGVFHLWGHSWEIESNDSWKDLEYVFSGLADMFPQEARLGNGGVCSTAGATRQEVQRCRD